MAVRVACVVMGLEDLLCASGVIYNLKAQCKREALQALADTAGSMVDAPAATIISMLLKREQLGSTGVGDGVAIPHCKIDGIGKVTGMLARLEKPIDFDADDEQPVDIIFMLLAPANAPAAHLKALAKVSRLLKDNDIRNALRGADSAEALFAIATSDHKDYAA